MAKVNPEEKKHVVSGLQGTKLPPNGAASQSIPKNVDRRSSVPAGKMEDSALTNEVMGSGNRTNQNTQSGDEQGNTNSFKDQNLDEDTLHDFATQKRILASCERVNLVNLQVLSMEGYPDNWSIDSARKTRDLLIMGSSIALGVFIIGLGGLLPAVISGIALGLCAMLMFLAFSPIQSAFTNKPSLTALMSRRQKITRAARGHVVFLEGNGGLAWRCEALGKYNSHLYNQQFSVLLQYSKAGKLAFALQSPRHFRLYLMFMIEAQKAYKKLQTIYLSEGFSLADT